MATLLFEIVNTRTNTNPMYPNAICEKCFSSNLELTADLLPEEYTLSLDSPCPLCGVNGRETVMVFLRSFGYPKLLLNISEVLNLLAFRENGYDYSQHDYNKTVLVISDLVEGGHLNYLRESRAAAFAHVAQVRVVGPPTTLFVARGALAHVGKGVWFNAPLPLRDIIQLGVMNSLAARGKEEILPDGSLRMTYTSGPRKDRREQALRRNLHYKYGLPAHSSLKKTSQAPPAALPSGPRA